MHSNTHAHRMHVTYTINICVHQTHAHYTIHTIVRLSILFTLEWINARVVVPLAHFCHNQQNRCICCAANTDEIHTFQKVFYFFLENSENLLFELKYSLISWKWPKFILNWQTNYNSLTSFS